MLQPEFLASRPEELSSFCLMQTLPTPNQNALPSPSEQSPHLHHQRFLPCQVSMKSPSLAAPRATTFPPPSKPPMGPTHCNHYAVGQSPPQVFARISSPPKAQMMAEQLPSIPPQRLTELQNSPPSKPAMRTFTAPRQPLPTEKYLKFLMYTRSTQGADKPQEAEEMLLHADMVGLRPEILMGESGFFDQETMLEKLPHCLLEALECDTDDI